MFCTIQSFTSLLYLVHMLACLLIKSVIHECAQSCAYAGMPVIQQHPSHSRHLSDCTSAHICLAGMQIQDVVLIVSQQDQSEGEGCSVLHSGGIKVSHEAQPNQLVQQQQALLQLQQHISKQHCLAAADLQQLLVEVGSACFVSV